MAATANLVDVAEEATATREDVERYETDANDGLWNPLYIPLQVYRYAVTQAPAVRDHLEPFWRASSTGCWWPGSPGCLPRA